MSTVPSLPRRLKREDLKLLDEHLADRQKTYKEMKEWLGTRGYRVTTTSIRTYAVSRGSRKPIERPYLLIDRILTPEHRTAYEALIADPRTSHEAAHEWLRTRGYEVCRTTVRAHRRRKIGVMQRVRDSAQLAREIMQIARVPGAPDFSEATLTKFEQVIFEQIMQLNEDTKIGPKRLNEFAKLLSQSVNSREILEGVRRDFEKTKRQTVAAAEAAAKSGATGKDVVDRMKEILGV